MQEDKAKVDLEKIAAEGARKALEEALGKKSTPPKCTFSWDEEGQLIADCETKRDRDLASRFLDEKGIVVKVKVTKEKS
ncbi:MAG TPA: hypothetical protein VMW64_05965 [Dehalococcoidia bacterium]|nr:hypothetical protein [Dehalococcoidia bacterium]